MTFWPKMGVLWGKIGEGVVRYRPLTNSFFLLGVLTSMPILVKIDQEMRPRECSQTDWQTDRLTHWQTQTDFIICPMLYAIAMGQIIIEMRCQMRYINRRDCCFSSTALRRVLAIMNTGLTKTELLSAYPTSSLPGTCIATHLTCDGLKDEIRNLE